MSAITDKFIYRSTTPKKQTLRRQLTMQLKDFVLNLCINISLYALLKRNNKNITASRVRHQIVRKLSHRCNIHL